MKTTNQPLRADVKDGRLVISIGIETLTWSSRAVNNGPLDDCDVVHGMEREFAQDVAKEMTRENEIGETPLIRFLNAMMRDAANCGSGAISWNKKGN